MNSRKINFYVITGGPGVGKTTLLTELASYGFKIVPENARNIIKLQLKENGDGLPWKNKERYAQLMLDASTASYKSVPENDTDIHFFDRGIVDTLCYANMTGLGISNEMDIIATTHLYNRTVFILPPWLAIYHTDNERKQTWEEAIATFSKMKETYLSYGYQVIEVPQDTVENRAKFILNYVIN